MNTSGDFFQFFVYDGGCRFEMKPIAPSLGQGIWSLRDVRSGSTEMGLIRSSDGGLQLSRSRSARREHL